MALRNSEVDAITPSQNKNLSKKKNVGQVERWVSGIIGGGLVYRALRKRSLKSIPSLIVGGSLIRRAATGHCSAYRSLDINRAPKVRTKRFQARRGFEVEEAVTIMKSPEELYLFWRHFPNLSRFMQHLDKVEIIDTKKSRWVARAPLGVSASWVAEIVDERPNQLIEWASLPGSWIDCSGTVSFRELPHDRGTEVRVRLRYKPPMGKLGHQFARLFRDDPSSAIRDDLRSFRSLMETGEIPFSQTQAKVQSHSQAESLEERKISL